MEIIMAHTKHGTEPYATALGLLCRRFEDGWYEDDEAYQARAAKIINALEPSEAEREAWRMLQDRSDYEYEYVEKSELT